MEHKNTRVRLKIWIQCETGETLIGEGQITLLEAIEREESINKTAAQ